IILNVGEVPGNDGFWDGGVGGGAVNDWRFGLQREAQGDVGRLRTDGTEDGPDLVLINHSNGIVRGRAPNCGIFRDSSNGRTAVLPVVVVVVSDQTERFAGIGAGGIGLVDGHLRAIEHVRASDLIGVIV